MKIHILAAQHGNELLGLKVIGKLVQQRANNLTFRIGHPEAVAKGVRYIQRDLNRSFNSLESTIEAAIAADIEREIKALAPDLIVDIHTSVSDVAKVGIVAKRSLLVERVAVAMGMEAVVVMPEYATRNALNGRFPDTSISLEFGRGYRSDALAADLAKRIRQLDIDEPYVGAALPVFEVFTEIDKNFDGLASIKNLQYNQTLDGYPFLAGPTTYETIGGFLARKVA